MTNRRKCASFVCVPGLTEVYALLYSRRGQREFVVATGACHLCTLTCALETRSFSFVYASDSASERKIDAESSLNDLWSFDASVGDLKDVAILCSLV